METRIVECGNIFGADDNRYATFVSAGDRQSPSVVLDRDANEAAPDAALFNIRLPRDRVSSDENSKPRPFKGRQTGRGTSGLGGN
jgi:hypothetical protein